MFLSVNGCEIPMTCLLSNRIPIEAVLIWYIVSALEWFLSGSLSCSWMECCDWSGCELMYAVVNAMVPDSVTQ